MAKSAKNEVFSIARIRAGPPYCMGTWRCPGKGQTLQKFLKLVFTEDSDPLIQISRFQVGLLIIPATLMLSLAMPLQAAVINVPEDYQSIKSALNNSQSGDQVQISSGIYPENNLRVPPGVTVSGIGETPADVVIDGENSGRIMLCESLSTTTIIQNITFINGLATGSSSYDQSGGAILLNRSNPLIRNCVFIGNYAENHGGAIRCSNASPQIIKCVFRNNQAPNGGGGALDCSYDSSPSVVDCTFEANSALWGGGLSCRAQSSPALYDCLFTANLAEGSLGYGGGFMVDFEAAPIFQRCTFYNNTGRFGGVGASLKDSRLKMQECTLVGNNTEWMGGGLVCSRSYPTIESSIIAFNQGAAISSGNGSLPIIRCSNIYGNTGGDWEGTILPQWQGGGNISDDPLFCEYPPSNGVHFNLMPESPCSAENNTCSNMGAWDGGCGISPVVLQDFVVRWNDGRAEISWHVPHEETHKDDFRLERATVDADGSAVPLGFQETSNGSYQGQDPGIQPVDGHQYDYRLFQRQEDDSLILLSSVRLDTADLPPARHLHDVHPNPFNPSTRIRLRFNQERLVTVTVNDIAGRRIRQLARRTFAAGEHLLTWDGRDGDGRACQSGTYIVLVDVDGKPETQKVTLLK